MKLAFKIALRFLKSNKGQTILISLGIAVGVSVQIFIGLLIQGLQNDLIQTTIGRTSQITVTKADGSDFDDYNNIIALAGAADDRLLHVSPVLDKPLFITIGDKSASVLLRGLDLEVSEGIYKTQESLINGEMPYQDGHILIGSELAKELLLDAGQSVEVLTPEGEKGSLFISGIFDFGVAGINSSWAVSSRKTAASLFMTGDVASAVEMQVRDVFSAKDIALVIENDIDNEFRVQNWQDQNQQLLSGLNGQSVSSLMIQIFVLIAVVLGIASVLAISVLQKSKQIGILKAMGIKDKTASLIFLFQGLMLGLIGAVMGSALGLALLVMFTSFAKDPDGSPIINISFDPAFILFSGLIAIAAAVIASLIPARKSLKLSPIEVIRNG